MFFLAACQTPEDEVLRVGMDLRFPPFETEDSNGDPLGISVDVALALGEYLGRPVEIVNTNFASLIPSLNSGEIDIIIASMSRTPERAEAIDFTETYFYFKIPSLVNRQFAEANNLTEDSTTEDLMAISSTKYTGITGQISASHPESLGLTVEIATNLEAAVINVVQGQADVLIMSTFPVVRGHIANPDDTIVIWDAWISSPIAMGVRKGETALLEQANAFIATMNEPGGLYDFLRDKWAVENLSVDAWDQAIILVLDRFGIDFFIDEN
jgi:polar amino acid transport system substrate-binding protein